MRIDVLSLFPGMFTGVLEQSIIGKAQERHLLDIEVTDFRAYSDDVKHHTVDDYPYGGGEGMLLKPQPIFAAMKALEQKQPGPKRVILLDPAGKKFDQSVAADLATSEHLVFICGHYEGYDERIRNLVTDEISLGDYVLTGGELGAMVVIDTTVRLLPGVLGNESSAENDSFSDGLLEHPQYTRPADFDGMAVPAVLTNGNHQLIAQWQEKESLRRTYLRRPDLLQQVTLTEQQQKLLAEVKAEEN
ncbi:tRNA (guanosine(37)-N1)-methyltransferase TrmD [Loigolactobacillus zhaoyuanensis]|uniref:tRNA (guanine-N(1)-)-methyltransferase n=1 Tax=Loigolactobacillus zhaoyuanensis TaxID=2486017 RepID=A0ABW8UAJ5_9LACO|nr:tRNA (guanosine(37)-N1)-methyltransferase TrmD [Loigolactobacillus zhaoyuanensis]